MTLIYSANTKCQYADCRDLFVVMLNAIMLSVVMLNVVMQCLYTECRVAEREQCVKHFYNVFFFSKIKNNIFNTCC
jgi:hypothetical protein